MMKRAGKNEFTFFGFDAETGEMTQSFDYDNKIAQVKDVAEQDEIAHAWMANGEDLFIMDRRLTKFVNDRVEAKKFKTFNKFKVSQEGIKSKFFE
jgi:hypothetical protein